MQILPDQLIMKSNILKAEQAITSQKEHKQFTAFRSKLPRVELQSSRVPPFEEGRWGWGGETRTVVLEETMWEGTLI